MSSSVASTPVQIFSSAANTTPVEFVVYFGSPLYVSSSPTPGPSDPNSRLISCAGSYNINQGQALYVVAANAGQTALFDWYFPVPWSANITSIQGNGISAVAPTDQQMLAWQSAASVWAPSSNPPATNALVNLEQYKISGSMNNYLASGTAAGTTLTFTSTHDFAVGQGIVVLNAGGTADGTTPPTPTIVPVGTNNASVNYSYQVASCLSFGHQVEGMSPASSIGSVAGNSTLSAGNYNKVQWTPGTNQQAYAVYGRVAGTMQLLGYSWFMGPIHFNIALIASASAPPFIGAQLQPNTSYSYCLTGIDYMGNETPILTADNGHNTITASTGSVAYGIALTWDWYNGSQYPYRYYNIYRATGAGAMGFLAQVNPFDTVYNDWGTVTPTGQAPPTLLTFVDNGQTALTGTAARPPHVPVTPPAAATQGNLYTSVTGVGASVASIANGLGANVSSVGVYHDDSAALNSAITALGTVTLPNGYYPIHRRVTVGSAGTLRGIEMPVPVGVNVSTTANPLPTPNAATLVLYSLQGAQQIYLIGEGCGLHNVQLFWPNQSNGTLSTQSWIPYPAAVHVSFGTIEFAITDIVDANSWVGMFVGNSAGMIRNVIVGALRHEILSNGSESFYDTFKSDPNSAYSINVNLPEAADRTCIRLFAGSSLNIINNVNVDGCTPVWVTTGNNAQGGNGAIGCLISNVWCDDFSPSLILDAPVSDSWSGGGQVFNHRIMNYYCVPGSGDVYITTGLTNLGGGANLAQVDFSNSRLANLHVTGQLYLDITGAACGSISCAATSPWITTPYIRIGLSNVGYGAVTRFNVTAGAVKATTAGCYTLIGNNWISDSVSAGTLYVMDEQTMRTERFTIPANTALSTGDNTIGHIILGEAGNTGNTLYVITATGSGTSATDVWKLNGTSLFTTAATVSSLHVGGMGEGVNAHISGVVALPLLTAVMTYNNAAGTSFNVLPVVLNVASGLTTSTPLELELTYCLTPVTA